MVNEAVHEKRESETEKRRKLLVEILDGRLPDNPIFQKVLDFYKGIFRQEYDLIVCMARKSWCVINLFLPLLKEDKEFEGLINTKKLTHDRMLHPWFAELEQEKHSQIKVCVIDDTFQAGRALDDCLRRLKWVYGVDEKNITVAVFAVTDNEYNNNENRINVKDKVYTVYPSHRKPSFKVNWGGGDAFYDKENISKFSYFFVEAIHACSEPYVGYIPAFRLPIEDVQKFLGAKQGKDIEFDSASKISTPGFLEQEDLRAPLSDPAIMGYYNITCPQMRQHNIESFYISLPALDSNDENYLPFLPPKHALSVSALRFYLNRNTGKALIVPYLSFISRSVS